MRLTAIAGIIGPILLAATIIGLTLLQLPFLRSLGWDPIYAPTVDWPSGLALGPYGVWMVAAFAICGVLLLVFAAGLEQSIVPGSPWGTRLLALSGVCLALLAFRADPTFLGTPRTLWGAIHDGAYIALGLSLLPALLLLAARFGRDPRWRGHGPFTVATALVAAPAFALKGILVYLFLGSLLLWFVLTALRLPRPRPRIGHE